MARLRYLQNKRSGAAGTISKADKRIYFFDDNAYIYAASSGVLHIVATTINLDGAFTFTGTDKLNLGTSVAPLTLTAGTPVMTVYTTCSGAVGTAAQPILFNTVLTGAGQVGGRVRVNLETEVTLGSYANAFKASVDLGTNGGVTGLLSVSCSEMTMATANISGTYAIEEWEMTYAATGSGSLPKPCFVYANTNGTKRTVFDDYGDFIKFGTGFTAATGHMLGAGTSTIRLGTGALGATKRYIPLSSAGDSFTTAYPIVSTSTIGLTLAALTVGDAYSGLRVAVTAAAPNNAYGMAAYFDTTITGTTTGHCYGVGSWINTSTTPVLAASHIIVPFEGGVYTSEAQSDARIVFGGQHQAILNGAPASLHAWRLNTNQTITAVIAAANAGSIGFATGETASTSAGTIAIADIVGTGVVYIQVYTTSA